ncbi:MAG: hypothetical protein ACRD15_17975 [Vicinamibacterales bacterium]
MIRVSAERFAFTPSQIEIDAGEEVEVGPAFPPAAPAQSQRRDHP